MKKLVLVLGCNKIGKGLLFNRKINGDICFEVIKSLDTEYSAVKKEFNINKLDTADTLNVLMDIIKKLYVPNAEFYTSSEAGREYILDVLLYLKDTCPVQFGGDLQNEWEHIILSIKESKVLFDKEGSTIGNARDEFHKLIKGNSEVLSDKDIPESLDNFTSLMRVGTKIQISKVVNGAIKPAIQIPFKDFLNDILSQEEIVGPYLISDDDVSNLFTDYIKYWNRDGIFIKDYHKMSEFLSKCIVVDAHFMFLNDINKEWDAVRLAAKFLGTTDTTNKDEILEGKRAVVIVTDETPQARCRRNGGGILGMLQDNLYKEFAIDKNKEFLISAVVVDCNSGSVLKVKREVYDFLLKIEAVGIDKIYIDSKLSKAKGAIKNRLNIFLEEVKNVYPNVEIEYKI